MTLRQAPGDRALQIHKATDVPPVQPTPNLQPLSVELLDFFARRGISETTLHRGGVMQEHLYAPPLKQMADTIAFPYWRRGQLVNVKYRTVNKKFWQASTMPSSKCRRPSVERRLVMLLVVQQAVLVFVSPACHLSLQMLTARPALHAGQGCGKGLVWPGRRDWARRNYHCGGRDGQASHAGGGYLKRCQRSRRRATARASRRAASA